MKTAFLIVNYNDYETTLKLINNIKNYSCLDKILIVDNCSTDDSFNKLSECSNETVEVMQTSVNKGYSAGINAGCKRLKETLGDCYIIISNPDIIIEKEYDIKKLIESIDNETAIMAPIINEHGKLNRGWKIPTPLKDTLLNFAVIHKWLRPKLLFYKNNYYHDIASVEAVSGCFFVINSIDLEKVNYFDENVFLYYEENIIAKKLQTINKKIKINTNIYVMHNHSVTIDKNISRIRKYKVLKKSQMYFQKTYNKANIFERFLLFITNKLTLLLLYIRGIFKK